MTQHLTDWYSGNIQPEREGVYETTDDETGPWYSYWNGSHWNGHWSNPGRAIEHIGYMSSGVIRWRGMTENQYPQNGTK